ncbi:MAG: DUF3500 domain-containing protein [Lewinella sp.]|nr:DUF3500 domain-containing protein [Lewinella sp.]
MQKKLYIPEPVKIHSAISLESVLLLVSAVCVIALFYASNGAREAGSMFDGLQENPAPFNYNFAPPVPSDLDVSQVVADAEAFYNSLSSAQQSTLQLSYTTTLARKWSNLPCGSGCRNGIQLGSLTSAQLTLAKQVIQDVLGASSDNGYQEYLDITTAEDYLAANGASSSQYNSGLRWLAFLNAPSETGAWMLQFGGHHYAANIAFNNGHVIGATPFFVALEPTTFTYNGVSYGPMEDERTALRTMLASLSSSELATAKLNTTFSDCLMSPGESNGNNNTFPSTKQGLAVSALTSAQKDLVLEAVRNYVEDMDSVTAKAVMARYTSEIDQTYIAFTGNGTAGSATSFLASNSNYARIDGPTVWIEFACQNGVVFQNQIHYHSVWRDHVHDYGVDLSGDAIDNTSTAVHQLELSRNISIYPNPADSQIVVVLPLEVADAVITVSDMSGRTVYRGMDSGARIIVDIQSLPKGSYILKVQEKNRLYAGKFIRN